MQLCGYAVVMVRLNNCEVLQGLKLADCYKMSELHNCRDRCQNCKTYNCRTAKLLN